MSSLIGRERRQEIDAPRVAKASQKSLVGRLYQVNLKSHDLGIEDDLGRSVHCEFPRDGHHIEAIRQLVGRRVVLTGNAYRDDDGDVQRFEVESIRAADHTNTEAEFFSFDVEAALSRTKPIDDLSNLAFEDLTETEAEPFWRALSE